VNCNQALCIEFLSALKFHREREPANILQYIVCNSVMTFGKRSILEVVRLTLYHANVSHMLLTTYNWQLLVLILTMFNFRLLYS
jgi:hypothetical protein